jgi:hypothetical protein
MLLTLLNAAAAVMALAAAVFNWRARAKSQDPRRRMVHATCASIFVLVAIVWTCLVIWR